MARRYKLPRDKIEDILREAMREANMVRVDELSVGTWRRQQTQKGIEWVLNYILKSDRPHFVCIERESIVKDSLPYLISVRVQCALNRNIFYGLRYLYLQ